MTIHHTVTVERVLEAVEAGTFGLADTGFCTACGEEAGGVEPDARNRRCDACDKRAVFGAEELLFHVAA